MLQIHLFLQLTKKPYQCHIILHGILLYKMHYMEFVLFDNAFIDHIKRYPLHTLSKYLMSKDIYILHRSNNFTKTYVNSLLFFQVQRYFL